MNERIEKLVTASFPGTSLGVLMMYSPELEKFAELIIRECGKSCTLQGDEDDMFRKFGIKQHTGRETE